MYSKKKTRNNKKAIHFFELAGTIQHDSGKFLFNTLFLTLLYNFCKEVYNRQVVNSKLCKIEKQTIFNTK